MRCCSVAIHFPVRQMMRSILNEYYSWTTETTATEYVQRYFLFLYANYNKDDFWKPVVNCRTGNGTKPNPTFLVVCICWFSSVPCDLSDRQQVICISSHYIIKWDVSWVFEFCRLHGGQFHLFTSYWCSLHQASDCCRYFPSFTGTVTIGLLSICPRITSLKFLSCSPCAVPPFELYSGGVVVLIIASLMSWSSNQGNQSKRHFMAIFKHICLFSLLL